MKRNQNVATISDFELALVNTVRRATFPAGHAHKRFIRDILPLSKLSDRGRWFLASIAHRYRRQYRLTPEQIAWVNEWLSKDVNLDPEPKTASVPVPLPETRKDELVPSPVSSGWLFGGDEQERA
jgi:hypothetical protein